MVISPNHIGMMIHQSYHYRDYANQLIQQKKMYQSIQNLDEPELAEALLNGAEINNGRFKSNTLNLCIKSLLSNPVDKFNIRIIETLLKNGSKDHESKNIYAQIMECYDNYVELNQGYENETYHNVLTLMQILEKHGFKSENQAVISALKTKIKPFIQIIISVINHASNIDNQILSDVIQTQWMEIIKFTINIFTQRERSMHESMILHSAIKTQNAEIIQIIIKLCEPNTDNQTINHAIRTGDYQIVKMMLMYGARINNSQNIVTDNSMACALQTCNAMIIKEIIIRGSEPCTESINLPHRFWDTIRQKQTNGGNLLELLMCAGVRISYVIHCNIKCKRTTKTEMELRIVDCYELQNKIYEPTNPRISELRHSLIQTMEMLMEWPHTKQNKINRIDQSLNTMIPVPCVNIIYEYQFESLVGYIDWSKY